MIEKIEQTYWVKIYSSGSIEVAKQVVRYSCQQAGLCVTIEPTTFIYTGGEEAGFVIGLINYPRFPLPNGDIWNRAEELAREILTETYQDSTLIMSPDKTLWITKREEKCR
jgi:hypothetical protein